MLQLPSYSWRSGQGVAIGDKTRVVLFFQKPLSKNGDGHIADQALRGPQEAHGSRNRGLRLRNPERLHKGGSLEKHPRDQPARLQEEIGSWWSRQGRSFGETSAKPGQLSPHGPNRRQKQGVQTGEPGREGNSRYSRQYWQHKAVPSPGAKRIPSAGG